MENNIGITMIFIINYNRLARMTKRRVVQSMIIKVRHLLVLNINSLIDLEIMFADDKME